MKYIVENGVLTKRGKQEMKKFTGLNCKHREEVAEYVGQYKFLRCVKCKTLRQVNSLALRKV